jgi:hypothetical protein
MKIQILAVAVVLVLGTTLGLKQTENKAAAVAAAVAAPENIAYFMSQRLGNDYQLTWATNSERKESRLELEKSFNERQFETLAVYKGADRNALKTYAYLDTTPFARTAHEVKVIYYRLKQVEPNQIFTYSKVISIVRDDDYDIYANPKPAL